MPRDDAPTEVTLSIDISPVMKFTFRRKPNWDKILEIESILTGIYNTLRLDADSFPLLFGRDANDSLLFQFI